jgi:phosphate transport system substrate-binding protein
MTQRHRRIALASLGLLAALVLACGSSNNAKSNNASQSTATVAPVSTSAAATGSAATAAASAPASGASTANVSMCPPSGAATSMTGAGSTFDAPLFAKQFDVYNQQCKIQVNYQSVGSGAGIQQLTAKTVNFGASDAPLTDQQIQAAGGDVLHIPITIGAVSVGYNLPGVKSGVKLTGDVLAKIYLGTIKKWNDPALTALNPGMNLPSLDISVVHRSDGSGTSFIFTNYLAAVNTDWQSKVGSGTSVNWPVGAGGKGSEGVAGIVKQTPGSIGYFELAYSTENNITYVTLQNKDGQYVAPSVAGASAAAAGAAANLPADLRAVFVNASGAQTYPISGFSWVVINRAQSDAKVAQSLVHLLWWMTHAGQQYASALQYAPLPPQVVQQDEKQLMKVTAAGQPVLGQEPHGGSQGLPPPMPIERVTPAWKVNVV